MKLLNLFSGTGSLSKAARQRGWETTDLDADPKCQADSVTDIMDWAVALQERGPACAQFSEALLQAAHHLDFPALNALAGGTSPQG